MGWKPHRGFESHALRCVICRHRKRLNLRVQPFFGVGGQLFAGCGIGAADRGGRWGHNLLRNQTLVLDYGMDITWLIIGGIVGVVLGPLAVYLSGKRGWRRK